MFIDSRSIEKDAILDTTICIAGGGIAGITLALELARAGIPITLIESGGFESDRETNDLYRGENVGLPYRFDHQYRSRFFGGSSNCWGGWNRPLEPEDFAKRDWIPYSGWPMDHREMQPFYERTHAVLQLGPHRFDSEFWGNAVSSEKAKRFPLNGARIIDSFSQFSPPARLGISHRNQIEADPNIRVLLHANVAHIATDETASRVSMLDIATLGGNRFHVRAKQFVLATGGIENARLLLLSNSVHARGIGNDHDLVGRFFMDHPRLQIGDVSFHDDWKKNLLYDIKYHKTRLISAFGTAAAAQLVLKPEVMRAEQLLQARVWFRSVFLRENSPRIETLYRFAHKPTATNTTRRGRLAHAPKRVAQAALDNVFTSKPFLRRVTCEIIVEPEPNADSRVTLADEKDALGLPRARVNWQLGPLVQKTIARTLQILASDLALAGIATIALPDLFPNGQWPLDLVGTWHHMGTTRMSDDPASGVVDRNCRVHGMENLYIAGSSVFPTGGGNFPTMTLTALAIRLGDHLRDVLRGADNAMEQVGPDSATPADDRKQRVS